MADDIDDLLDEVEHKFVKAKTKTEESNATKSAQSKTSQTRPKLSKCFPVFIGGAADPQGYGNTVNKRRKSGLCMSLLTVNQQIPQPALHRKVSLSAYFTGAYDLWVQLERDTYYCTGFMAVRTGANTVELIRAWRDKMVNLGNKKNDQAGFQSIVSNYSSK
ncbi:hypothetical protein MAR_027512, partial [Mya arenaria]